MEKRIIRLTESDIQRIVKRVITEQITPVGKLNLFCKSNRNNDSFHKNNLKYNQASKKPSGVTEIILDIETYVPDNIFGEDDQNFVLNVTPVSLLGDKYSDELDIIDPNDTIVLMNYSSSGVAYFCQIDSGTDQEWADYFNTF